MLKMLRHDLKFVWPVWRIVAPIVVVLAAICGAIVGVGYSEYEIFEPIYGLLMLTAMLIDSYWNLILSAFSMLVTVLIVVRYYKNFFTDEGYLTFTLPVSRTKLLNSKILMAAIWMAATSAVCIIASVVYSLAMELTLSDENMYFSINIAELFEEAFKEMLSAVDKIHLVLFVIEILLFALAASASSLLLLLLCITIGSVIVKKAKLVLGLGIYFGANSVIGTLLYIVMIVGVLIFGAAASEFNADETAVYALLHLILSAGGLLFSGLAIGSYLLNKKLINKHLNLP